MNKITKLLAFALAITTAAAAHAQVTGTSLINKPTLTTGNYTSTNTFLYTDRTGIGVRKVTAPDILDFAGLGLTDVVTHGGAILNGNLTVTGTSVLAGTLTLSGGLISTSATISGNASVIGSLTATGGLSVYNDGYYARNAAAVKLSVGTAGNPFITMNSTSITSYQSMFSGAGIGFGSGSTTNVGLFSPSAGILKVSDASTGLGALQTGNISMTGTLAIQPGGTPSINLGTGATAYCYLGNHSTIASYVALFNGAGLSFGHNNSPRVGLISTTEGVLRCNDTGSNGLGTFQTGGFAGNFRALAASGNITVTDNVVTLTGAITLSLPSTSITGQQFIVKNIGGVTGTATVVGGTKTIDGATTQAIISGAGKSSAMTFTYDGTNYIISQ